MRNRRMLRKMYVEQLEVRALLATEVLAFHDAEDVDRDGYVTPLDALVIINAINASSWTVEYAVVRPELDVNRDLSVSAIDALMVINRLNASWSESSPSDPSEDELLLAAAAFPAMPRGTSDLIPFVQGLPTFSSGSPFNDLNYTLLDTDYMDGENSGGDTFLPVDPSHEFPGSDRVKYIRTALNTDLDAVYQASHADRIILGTAEIDVPFFTMGADGVDNDYAVIHHFDYRYGGIQLRGGPDEYRLARFSKSDGVQTSGYYLFYIGANKIDLIAFIFDCDDLEPAVSGRPPSNLNALCNASGILDLRDSSQFIFAEPLSIKPALPGGIAQVGTQGKEIISDMTVDKYGNTYLVGSSDGSFNGLPPTDHRIFVAKTGINGDLHWATELRMAEGTMLKAVVTDDEFVYVAGRTLRNLPGFTNAGRWDGILLKLRIDNGDILAMDQWGNAGIDGYGNLVLDDAGYLYTSAQGSPVGDGGTDDVYLVAKHRTSDLSNVWRQLNPTVETGFAASAEAWGGLTYVPSGVPGQGRLVVAGWYFTNNGANAFASVYEDLHLPIPTRPHSITLASPGPRAEWILDSVVDSRGNIYFAGYTTGNLGGPHLGEGDAFIVKYDATLANPIIRQLGTEYSDLIGQLEIDENDTIYAVGHTYGDYAGANLDPNRRSGDILIIKFDSELNILDKVQFGTEGEDRAWSHLLGGNLFLGGMTEATMVDSNRGSFDGFVVAFHRDQLDQTLNLGDINEDGVVNLLDVQPMTDLISAGGFHSNADFDFDGAVTLLDVSPFIDRLNS
ncbi:MAG: dockerin type I domain-containing protein [Pirellula sp.]